MDNTSPPQGGPSNDPPDGTVYRPAGAGSDRPQDSTGDAGQPTLPVQGGYTPDPGYSPPSQESAAQGYPPSYPQQPPQQGFQTPAQVYGQPGPQQPYPQQPYPQQPQYPQQPYAPQYPPQQVVVQQKKGPILPIWLSVTLGILVAFCAICVIGLWLLGAVFNRAGTELSKSLDVASAGFTAVGFDVAMSTESYETAHGFLGGNLARQYSVQELQRRWEALEGSGTITSTTSEATASGSGAQVTWTLTPSEGSEKKVRLTLEKSGDEWKITGADPELIPSP